MLDIKKGLKIITFVFVLLMCFSILSYTNAASYNRGSTKVQFGWDKNTPEDGTTISANTGGAIYYRSARIDGKQAYCMDYLKSVPKGSSIDKIGSLTTKQLAVLYEGGKMADPDATQLAFWKACGGINYRTQIEPTTYFKSGVVQITKSKLNELFNKADAIYNAAIKYDSSDFSSSKNVSIKIDKSQRKTQIKDGYLYKGPYKVTTNSEEDISINIEGNPSGVLVVGSVGATTTLNKVPANGIIYLKVLVDNGSGSQKINFSTSYTTSKTVGEIYSTGVGQRLAIINTENDEGTAKNGITISWDLEGSIKIVKREENSNKAVSGATFTLYNSSKKTLQTKVTDSNGIIEFTNLTYGTYYIKEISAPQGYLIVESDFQQVILDSDEEEIMVENRLMKGRIRITKYVKYEATGDRNTVGNGEATFKIYTSNGIEKGTITTNDNGVATSGYLPLGSYYLKEIAVNTNYMELNSTKRIDFSINESNYTSIIVLDDFENKGLTGTLEIYKYATENNTEKAIQGAKFGIYNKASASDADLIEEVTTNAAGKAYVYDLMDGTYWYKELSVPAGYKLDSTVKSFSVSTANRKIKVSVENEILYGTLNIEKKDDENKEPLKGIVFKVYASNKKTVVATLKTDANGKASTKLKYGTYYVKEYSAPSNVIMNTKEEKIIIGEGNGAKVTYDLSITNKLIDLGIKLYKVDENSKPISGVQFALYSDSEGKNLVKTVTTDANGLALFDNLAEGTYYYKEISTPEGYIITKISRMEPIKISYSGTTVYEETIENKTIKGKVKVYKINEDKQPIKGVEFNIKDSNGEVVGTLITNEKGEATSDDLKKGTYTLVETKVPSGYVLSEEAVEFVINTDGEVVEKTIENEYQKGKVKVKKVDADTKEFIDGAVFKIYKYNDDGTEKYVDTIQTYDSKGVGTSQELKNGKYYLIETVAPDGAILDNTKYEFEITDAAKVFEITVENKIKKGQIALIKNDDKGNPIEGVKFQILDSDKKTVIEELTTDATGKATSSRIKVGTYYVKETYTPELYVQLVDLIKVEIQNDNQVITLKDEIINERITGGIKVIKKNDAGTPIAGVEFAVYKEGAALPTTTLVTNEQGVAMYTDLVLGKYYFVETKVPDNLYINSEKVSFEITEIGQLIEKTVVNERVKGKLVINKTNSENGTGIEGVTFEIYDANKNVLGSIYTDANGVATTENLKDKNGNVITLYAGTYYYAETAAPNRFYFETDQYSFTIAKGSETVTVNVQNIPFKIPQTGGVMGTDTMIITIVSIVSIAGYIFGNIMINRRRFA